MLEVVYETVSFLKKGEKCLAVKLNFEMGNILKV